MISFLIIGLLISLFIAVSIATYWVFFDKKGWREREHFSNIDWGKEGDYSCTVKGYKENGKMYITDVEHFDRHGNKVEVK